jgi:HPt (histidine-containing phosphotransfer) domain-containing protein
VVDPRNTSEKSSWIVQVDPDIADLVPGFLENRRRDVARAQAALEQGDLSGLAMLGHTMKGAGSGYGFDEITVIGAAMETAAKQGDVGAVSSSIARLAEYLNNVDVRYDG